MKKIALVNPPHPNKGCGYLLGVGYIASTLKAAACEPRIFDKPCFSYREGAARLISEIAAFRPDAIGFSLISSGTVYWAYDFLKTVKRAFPAVPIIAGGLHSTLLPAEALDAGFDFAVIGDGEETFPKLLSRIREGTSPGGLDGVAWRAPNGDINIPAASYVKNLDKLPFPANRFYVECLSGNPRPYLCLIFSRGCFRTCTFCVERHLNRGVRFRGADNVMEEITDAWSRHKINVLHFLDSSFLEDRRRVMDLCGRFIEFKKTTSLSWKCLARADHLDPDLLDAMKQAGCEDIFFGFESADNDTLKRIKKNITVEDNERAIALCLKAGIRPHGYLIAGFPWETESHDAKSAAFRDLHKNEVDTLFFAPVPYPGTELYEEYHERYGFTDWWRHEKPGPLAAPGRPLHRWLRCFDLFLERNFFDYPPDKWLRISAFLPAAEIETGGPGVKMAFYRLAIKFMSKTSAALESVSPKAEHALMPAAYRAFQAVTNRMKKLPLSAAVGDEELPESHDAEAGTAVCAAAGKC
jgi:anaerobic magnesium-protoporphyrin IX monomethyl ester cyclase